MPDDLDINEVDGRMLLNSVPGVGPVTFQQLLNCFNQQPRKILSANEAELRSVKGVGKLVSEGIKNSVSSGWIEKEKERLTKIGGAFLLGDQVSKYLKELSDPPLGLYCLGEIPYLPCISIVGTRIPSNYGKKMARMIAGDLAKAGICVVSGMARGIDTEAHQGALDAGGKTIAFLGSGLDVIYPPENLDLYRRIQQSGAVLSEFPLGRKADRRTFPMRNRLVAGVSLGVLVIESAKTGGSMITARLAGEQGRTVFALPGRVDQPESQGCLELIRDGATLVRNANDILDEIMPMLGEFNFLDQPTQSLVKQEESLTLEQNERIIMNLLREGDSLSIDQLQLVTKIPLSGITSSITMLEIQGFVSKRADGNYEAT
jgi:DNA processing protein